MRSCYFLSYTALVSLAPVFFVAPARADETLPAPIPVLRIGGSNSEPESVPARRVELSPETITERYPNRKTKIERQVVQDDERNYVNHGPWKMWDLEGRLVAHGEYRFGKQHGKWVQLMSTFSFAAEEFQPPFTSQADFANGQLQGTWTVSDSRQKMVGSWDFDHGELHGKAIRWHPSGHPQEELMFKRGKLEGECDLFSAEGSLVNREYFRTGRQLIPVVNWHEPNEQKQAEGWMQTTEVVVHTTIDWWRGHLDIVKETPVDEPLRVGKWTEWYANGNTRFSGMFHVGRSVGTHTWWHENGQKQLVGHYDEGVRVGRWTRWHANGHKQEEGEFYGGNKRGVWKMWADTGALIDEQLVALVPDADIELVPILPISDKP